LCSCIPKYAGTARWVLTLLAVLDSSQVVVLKDGGKCHRLKQGGGCYLPAPDIFLGKAGLKGKLV
jgi:hypothetical protein